MLAIALLDVLFCFHFLFPYFLFLPLLVWHCIHELIILSFIWKYQFMIVGVFFTRISDNWHTNFSFWQIRVIERNCEIPHEGPFCDLMWSDPEDIETWAVSPRGAGWLFGSRVTSEVILSQLKKVSFLKIAYVILNTENRNTRTLFLQFNHINNLDLVCRAHQLVQEGLKYMFQDKGLVTVRLHWNV